MHFQYFTDIGVQFRTLRGLATPDYSTLSSEELALACLRSGDETAWSEFIRRFHPLIARVVLRVTRQCGESSLHVVDDLIQETYLKLCSSGLESFKCLNPAHPDAIYGYIKTCTANLVHDHFKASRAAKRGGAAENVPLESHSSDRQHPYRTRQEVELERKLLLQEIAEFLVTATSGENAERDRRIFWLYYRVGLTANAIAKLPTISLSIKGVESIIARLTRVLRDQLGSEQSEKQKSIDSLRGIDSGNSF